MKLLPALAISQISCIYLLATSSVEIREGPAYAGLTRPDTDCLANDETVRAVRIETAIFDDDGQEIRRVPIVLASNQNRVKKSVSLLSMKMGAS